MLVLPALWLAAALAAGSCRENNSDRLKAKSPTRKPTGQRSLKNELVLERFMENLLSSERYLKLIEVVDKKVDRLDLALEDRANLITKHVLDMVKMHRVRPRDSVEGVKLLRTDLERARKDIVAKIEEKRENHEPIGDSNYETKLDRIEMNMKTMMSALEAIMNTMAEVKSKYPTQRAKAELGSNSGTSVLVTEIRKVLQEQKQKKCECRYPKIGREGLERYPNDCQDIQKQGFNVTGIYKIKPTDMEPFYVLCDLASAGGGWTSLECRWGGDDFSYRLVLVFQNRFNGKQDFFKSWMDYSNGFGNLAGEFWLGLEKLFYLTNQRLYELRVELETNLGVEAYAGYSVFTIGSETEGYRISTLGTYYGDAGDSLSYHAGQKFSTPDVDNDAWKEGSCAVEHGGAWWYNQCDKSNLNGRFSSPSEEITRSQTIHWITFKGPSNPLMKTRMMIRPLPATKVTSDMPLSLATYQWSNRETMERGRKIPAPRTTPWPARTDQRLMLKQTVADYEPQY